VITFETGSHLRIRPQITTFCGRLISGEQPTGSHAALFSKTGNPLVLSCGYTEIVSSFSILDVIRFDHLQTHSGLGQERTMVRPFVLFQFSGT
jgi:hypothetical protein